MKIAEHDRQAEKERILARVERESGLIGGSAILRTVTRARDHMAGADADPADWAELWGTRIGRLLSLAAFVGLSIWLFAFLTRGG